MVHQTVSEQSNSSLESNTKASTAGITSRYHQNADSRFTRLFGNRASRPSRTITQNHQLNGLSSSLRRKYGMFAKGRSLYVRWKIPKRLQSIIGRTHFVRSLKTGRWADAVRMVRIVGVEFENMLREAEGASPMTFNTTLSHGSLRTETPAHSGPLGPNDDGMTLEQAFAMFVNDPSKKRAPTTMMRYHEIMPVVYEVIPRTTPVRQIDRAMCRRFLEMIKWLPANATKRFPNVSAKVLSERSKVEKIKRLLSPQTVNFYMINLTAVLNFAINEEWMDRNPAKGLRVADPVRTKDKRLPYSSEQLRQIFSTSIYTTKIDEYRDTAKFWIPLIGLYGLRLNEAAGLLTEHIQLIEEIPCFVIKETEEKSLKTTASERIVPIPDMIKEGMLALVARRRMQGEVRLFPELKRGRGGLYSHEFSKWWGRHARSSVFYRERTCLHSLRHNFRQAMREARVDEEMVLALGGWTPSGKSEVQRNYGSGFPIQMLEEAINSINYPQLDVSHLFRMSDFERSTATPRRN